MSVLNIITTYMETPILDIIAIANKVSLLSDRIAQGLDTNSKYHDIDDAISSYTALRVEMEKLYDTSLAFPLLQYAEETQKQWDENQSAKELTEEDLISKF